MKTIKNLVLELDELKQRRVVWEEIKSFLDAKNRDEKFGIKMEDGRRVDAEVVLNMLGDIDETIADIESRVKKVESTEVAGGKRGAGKKVGGARKKS